MSKPWSNDKLVIALTSLSALVILALDLYLPGDVIGGVPYIIPVLIALLGPWTAYIYIMAIVGTTLSIVGYLVSNGAVIHWLNINHHLLAIFAIWVTATLCARIKNHELQLSGVIGASAEGIISISEQGTIQSFNSKAEEIFGYRANEVLGRNVSMLMPAPDSEQHDDYLDQYLKTRDARIIGVGRRVRARHKDGRIIPVFLNIIAIQQGKHTGFTGFIRDLTKEEEKESQLQQLWRAVDQSPVSIIITDLNGDIEYANPFFSKVTGYQLDEVLGKNPRILNSGKNPPELYRQLWETISQGGVWRGTMQNRKKNNEPFWESNTICPVLNQNSAITHYIALKEDITDQREKEQMLTRAMKLEAIGRMTDGIAHDFNNLLTIILGNLQLVEEDIDDDRAVDKELVEDALSAAEDGSELIKQMLVFSRRQEQLNQPTELIPFLEKIWRLLRRTVPEDIAITLELASDTGTVFIDQNRLESAILNLVTNARDAMPEGGRLTISTGKDTITKSEETDGGRIAPGAYVNISVTDTGTGMPDDVKAQVLEPFYTTKTSSTGTGLGLSMVHDFISQSGGGIRIDSTHGSGTAISLLLPVHESGEEWITEEVEGPNTLPGGNETILLVEDRDKVRQFASRILKRLGYHLLEAENAVQALNCLQANSDIDLLFTDIIMPGEMNGRQLARQAASRYPLLKILLTTGMELHAEERGNSPDDFKVLPKPYTTTQLAQSIRHILDTKTDITPP